MTPPDHYERRIEVDHELCVGAQMCMGIAPRTFAADDSGQAIVADPEGDPIADQREAEINCPVAAITVENEATEDHE